MQILWTHPSPTELETLQMGAQQPVFRSAAGDSYAHSSVRTTDLEKRKNLVGMVFLKKILQPLN